MRLVVASICCIWATAGSIPACELCAIYNANGARGEFRSGLSLTVEEQFIPFRTEQFQGHEVNLPYTNYLDNSITHLVPTYNFSPRLGISFERAHNPQFFPTNRPAVLPARVAPVWNGQIDH